MSCCIHSVRMHRCAVLLLAAVLSSTVLAKDNGEIRMSCYQSSNNYVIITFYRDNVAFVACNWTRSIIINLTRSLEFSLFFRSWSDPSNGLEYLVHFGKVCHFFNNNFYTHYCQSLYSLKKKIIYSICKIIKPSRNYNCAFRFACITYWASYNNILIYAEGVRNINMAQAHDV